VKFALPDAVHFPYNYCFPPSASPQASSPVDDALDTNFTVGGVSLRLGLVRVDAATRD
jgi:hypothetical protein